MQAGELTVVGRLPESSNNALLCESGGEPVVYKPVAGENPLWDFPASTLCRREMAAATLDSILGWGQVPATEWCDDGPAGPGVVQSWVDGRIDIAAFAPGGVPAGWVAVVDAESDQGPVEVAHRTDTATCRMVVFDAIANNADRKGGHLLRTDAGLFGIDHGVTFHTDPKLRTVLWGLAGDRIADDVLDDVGRALERFDDLLAWLTPGEVAMARQRADELLGSGTYPHPSGQWPPLPWPLI